MQGKVGWTIVKGYSFKKILSTRERQKTHNEQSTGEKATEAVPVWLHQALTDFLPGLPCGTSNHKGQKNGLGDGAI